MRCFTHVGKPVEWFCPFDLLRMGVSGCVAPNEDKMQDLVGMMVTHMIILSVKEYLDRDGLGEAFLTSLTVAQHILISLYSALR